MDSPQSRLQWQGRHEPGPPRAFPVKRLCQHACAPDLEAPEGWPEAWPGEGMLFHGDNAEVLSHLLATGFAGRVQLVYIDPPFGSGADYARKLWLRGGGAIDLGLLGQHAVENPGARRLDRRAALRAQIALAMETRGLVPEK